MPEKKLLVAGCSLVSLRNVVHVVALGTVLLKASVAPGQRLPLPPQEQEAVNDAIDRGVAYLKRTQQKSGTWANPRGNWTEARMHEHVYAIGFAALPGLTLLECGMDASDPIIQQAARFVRSKAANLDRTYELSLALLFLDRLGDPMDKKLIQTFALRLIAGQSATGGWGYRCPLLRSRTQTELLTALRRLDPPQDAPGIAERPGKKSSRLIPSAPVAGAGPIESAIAQPSVPSLSGDIRRGSPREPSSPSNESLAGPPQRGRDCLDLAILDEKNLESLETDGKVGHDKSADAKTTQHKPSKPYVVPERLKRLPVLQDPAKHILQDPLNPAGDLGLTPTDNSNTQFAILALWRAQHYEVPMRRSLNLIVRRYLTSQNADGSWGYHYQLGGGANPIRLPNSMTCVGLIGLAIGHGLAQTGSAGQLVQDARIINGLIALSASIGQPVEHQGWLPMQNLYFLWSLERVAVLYNLPTIGDKDWYRWGAQVLVRNQGEEGNWAGGLYIGSTPILDTCLALLFLKRANLVKDLTAKLPFTADDLNNSIMRKLAPAPTPKPVEIPKATEKTALPIELRKPMKPASSLSSPPPSLEVPAPVGESGSSKKKWIVISAIFFVSFSGGSLVLILLAINRGKEAEGEEKQEKKRKRSFSREPKASG